MRIDKRVLIPFGLLILLQVLDIVVHVATLQIEPMRITANAILSAGALATVLPNISEARFAISLAVTAYLALNLLFLAQHGTVNPTTGALRLPLFVFVVGSLGLSQWLRLRIR